jgi:prepilin-type N-terminal cleavage/methylation domain-containing protein
MKAPVRKNAGFTLIEIMIAVAILGIMTFMAIPSIQGLVHKYRARTAAREFVGLFMRGRAMAVQAPIALGSSPYQMQIDCGGDSFRLVRFPFVDNVVASISGGGKAFFAAASDFPGVNVYAVDAGLNAAPASEGNTSVTRTLDRTGSSESVSGTRNYTVFFEAPGNNRYRVQVYGTVGAVKVVTGW